MNKNIVTGIKVARNMSAKMALRLSFGTATAVGGALYHGLDPAHLTLSYGVASAITGLGAVLATNAAAITVVSTLGAFALTQMTLAGCKSCRDGGTVGHFLKKTFNAAASSVTGVTAFLLGGVGGMALASNYSGAQMFSSVSGEGNSLFGSAWSSLFGNGEGNAVAGAGPYDFAEISDAFEHFDFAEIDTGDAILGLGETLGQIQGTVLTGLEDAFKEPTWTGAIISPDFAAAALVAGCAIGACIVTYKASSRVLDYVLSSKTCEPTQKGIRDAADSKSDVLPHSVAIPCVLKR